MIDKSQKEIQKILEPYNADIKRHMAALSEEFQSRVQTIGEQYGSIQETLESHTEILESHTEILGSHTKTFESHTKTLESHTEMIGKMAEDIEVIKSNVEFLKGGMKKKVDYDEFLALERRLSLLEAKGKR